MYTPTPYRGSRALSCSTFHFRLSVSDSAFSAPLRLALSIVKGVGHTRRPSKTTTADIIPAMTLVEITYQLQSPLSLEQLNRLGEFANTYGLRRLRVDEQKNQLTFEYDASRLRDTQVAHVLGQAGIAVTRRLN